MTRVSVIVRTYNRGYILAEALGSVLAQTFRDLEVVVVDDGSTDDTATVLGACQDPRVRVVRHERNRGVSAAGNTGIREARGELVASLDSDDLWHPTMLATLVACLDRHPEADVAFCGLEVVRPGGDQEPADAAPETNAFGELIGRLGDPAEVVLPAREMYLVLLETVPLKPTTTVIRRQALRDVGGYDESWRSGEDWELYLRLSREHRFAFVNETLATMRVQSDSTLGRHQVEDKSALIAWERIEKRASRGDPEAQRALVRAMARHYDILGHSYRTSGRRAKAAATYAEGFLRTRRAGLGLRAGTAVLPAPVLEALRTVRARRQPLVRTSDEGC